MAPDGAKGIDHGIAELRNMIEHMQFTVNDNLRVPFPNKAYHGTDSCGVRSDNSEDWTEEMISKDFEMSIARSDDDQPRFVESLTVAAVSFAVRVEASCLCAFASVLLLFCGYFVV